MWAKAPLQADIGSKPAAGVGALPARLLVFTIHCVIQTFGRGAARARLMADAKARRALAIEKLRGVLSGAGGGGGGAGGAGGALSGAVLVACLRTKGLLSCLVSALKGVGLWLGFELAVGSGRC